MNATPTDASTAERLAAGPKRGLSLRRYRIIVWVAFASLYVIIVTGSLVRLTGSGLGCIDWPACNEEQLVEIGRAHV